MKPYCTQNDGDCATCSLRSYGRDCKNHRGDDWAITVSGACPTFAGPELIEVIDHTVTIEAARGRRDAIEAATGRIMYLSRVSDL